MTKTAPWLGIAAFLGFAHVTFGAMAAHGVSDPKAVEWLHTGAQYGFIHCLACFAAAAAVRLGYRGAGRAIPVFLAGVVTFSGTLYAMAFGAPRILGAITPIGGLAMMAGWLLLAFACFRQPSDA